MDPKLCLGSQRYATQALLRYAVRRLTASVSFAYYVDPKLCLLRGIETEKHLCLPPIDGDTGFPEPTGNPESTN